MSEPRISLSVHEVKEIIGLLGITKEHIRSVNIPESQKKDMRLNIDRVRAILMNEVDDGQEIEKTPDFGKLETPKLGHLR